MVTIHLTEWDLASARQLVRDLNEKDEIRILIGKYDKESHKFISPASPQGRLLAMEWKAVPALILTLEDPNLSYRKRGWILSLLYSITLEDDLDPTGSDVFHADCVLPTFRSKGYKSWTVTWQGGFSSGWGGEGLVWAQKEDVVAQQKFAQKWLQFRDDYIKLIIHD
jgi:hypothetical protein